MEHAAWIQFCSLFRKQPPLHRALPKMKTRGARWCTTAWFFCVYNLNEWIRKYGTNLDTQWKKSFSFSFVWVQSREIPLLCFYYKLIIIFHFIVIFSNSHFFFCHAVLFLVCTQQCWFASSRVVGSLVVVLLSLFMWKLLQRRIHTVSETLRETTFNGMKERPKRNCGTAVGTP